MTQVILPPGLQIVERVLDAGDLALSPELARLLLTFTLPQADRERMTDLNVKANRGTLSPDEQRDLDSYLWLCNVLSLLHAKARLALKVQNPAA